MWTYTKREKSDDYYFSLVSGENAYYQRSKYNKYNYRNEKISNILKGKSRIEKYYSKAIQRGLNIPEHTKDLINELISNTLECMICNELIKKEDPVWSCTTCWTIYHLKCINHWIEQKAEVRKDEPLKWTCPHCNSKYETEKTPEYNCYCGKYYSSYNDKHFDPDLIPHGCGIFCGFHVCEHIPKCILPCHPGPHVQCKKIVKLTCFCEKHSKEVPCTTDLVHEYSCGEICGKKISCPKNHFCKAICHKGPCESFFKKGKCYECIAESRDRVLNFFTEVQDKLRRECFEAKNLTNFAKAITKYIFNGELPCGEHFTDVKIDLNLKLVLRLLEVSGDNLIENLKKYIPICDEEVQNSCYCRSKTSKTECFKLNYPEDILDFLGIVKEKELEKCTRVCKTLKNCKIHRCERVCCELRDIHITNYSRQDPMGYHLCMLTCGKLLPCGKHNCENYCHRGQCKPCAFIIREGTLYCSCKKTKVDPPYLCGTKVTCNYPCSAPRSCEHPCPLNCHEGPCPPCEFLTFKKCRCGKTIINDVKCGDTKELLCNNKCESILNCGVHFCEIRCHNHTEEFDETYVCTLPCLRELKKCKHLCKQKCHGESDCDEYACNENVFAYCKCKAISKEMPCKELKKLNENASGGVYLLECGEECVKQERLRNIREAFEELSKISEEKLKLLYPNYTPECSEDPKKEIPGKYDWDTLSMVTENIKEIMQIEQELYTKVREAKNKIEVAQPKAEEEKKAQDDPKQEEEKKESTDTPKENNENSLKNPTEETKIKIPVTSSIFDQVCEWLIIYHNLKPKKLVQNKVVYITLENESLKHFHYQPYKVSLIALLLKHNLFAISKKIKVYHPFQYTILIRNYRANSTYEGVETSLINYSKILKNDFYLNEFEPKEFYIHFFRESIGKKTFLILKKIPSDFQEVYEVVYDTNREIKNEDLYLYYKDEHYFNYLDNGYDSEYCKKEEKPEKVFDEDGFEVVSNKKRKKKGKK